jgi:hypothetical protein
MQNAALIRYHAMSAKNCISTIKYMSESDKPYLDLVLEELLEFKALFKEWIKLIDPSKAIEDEWGLFNPPGIDFRELEHYDRMDDIDFDDLEEFMGDEDV